MTIRTLKICIIVGLIIITGCGKAAKNAFEAASEAPSQSRLTTSNFLEQQLAVSLPTTVIKALLESEEKTLPFEVLPFMAVLQGQATRDGVS